MWKLIVKISSSWGKVNLLIKFKARFSLWYKCCKSVHVLSSRYNWRRFEGLALPEEHPRERNFFKKNEGLRLEAHIDAYWVGSVVCRRSTSGYYTFLGRNLLTWSNKKQNVVVRTSVEVEFRAMAQGLCEVLWQKIILSCNQVDGTIILCDDNRLAINIAHNLIRHDRTKHVEIDCHLIKEKLKSGLFTPYVSDEIS